MSCATVQEIYSTVPIQKSLSLPEPPSPSKIAPTVLPHCMYKIGHREPPRVCSWVPCRGTADPKVAASVASIDRLVHHLSPSTMSDVLANPKLCKNCVAPGCEFKCQCKQGYYCSEKCQRAHWQVHKKECAIHLSRKVKDAKREHGKEGEEVAQARLEGGLSHLNQGRYGEAERYFVEARQIYTRACGAGHHDVGRACRGLGRTYFRSGRYEEGMGLLNEALGIFRTTEGERSLDAGRCLSDIGEVLQGQGKLEEALDICTEAGGSKHTTVASVLTHKGNCYFQMGRLDEALAKHKRALVIQRIVYGDDSVHVAVSLGNIGSVFYAKGMLVEARTKDEEDLEITRRVRGEKHPDVATSLNNIALVLKMQGQLDEALEMHEKALKSQCRALGEDHVTVANSLKIIGMVYADQGKLVEALEMYGKALAIFHRAPGIDNRDSAEVHCRIACTKEKCGDVAGALVSARESVRICNKLGITDEMSRNAANLVRELEHGE